MFVCFIAVNQLTPSILDQVIVVGLGWLHIKEMARLDIENKVKLLQYKCSSISLVISCVYVYRL